MAVVAKKLKKVYNLGEAGGRPLPIPQSVRHGTRIVNGVRRVNKSRVMPIGGGGNARDS